MSNFNNFNDIKKYIDEKISGIKLPDHYKGIITVVSKTLVPTNQTILGTPTKTIKVFENGDKWLVTTINKTYVFNNNVWTYNDTLVPQNGDFYIVGNYLKNDSINITKNIPANILYNRDLNKWDIVIDLYSTPDEEYVLTDSITSQITLGRSLKSLQDILKTKDNSGINILIQKLDDNEVDKIQLSQNGLIKVENNTLNIDPKNYLDNIIINNGDEEENKYISSIIKENNDTIKVIKKKLPAKPTLEELGGQLKNPVLDALSELDSSTKGILKIKYDSALNKYVFEADENIITNEALTNKLKSYALTNTLLEKLSNTSGNKAIGNNYYLKIYQNSNTATDYDVSFENIKNLINFGTDIGTSGPNSFLADLTLDNNGRLVKTYKDALTSIGVSDNLEEIGKAITKIEYLNGNLVIKKSSFLTEVKCTLLGSGNVVNNIEYKNGVLNIHKNINALTSITKTMVEEVLIGDINTHTHNNLYDSKGSANSALNSAKSYSDTQITDKINELLTNGTSNNLKLVKIIKDVLNIMISDAQFPDLDD